jgi:hypothetical protein
MIAHKSVPTDCGLQLCIAQNCCLHNNPIVSFKYRIPTAWLVSWNSTEVIETRPGLDGLEIETRWGRDFLFLSRWALGRLRPSI